MGIFLADLKSKKEKPPARIELATFRLQGGCSTTKLRWLIN